jgi:hypothetical protein
LQAKPMIAMHFSFFSRALRSVSVRF